MLHLVQLYANIQLEYSFQDAKLNLMVLMMKISWYHKTVSFCIYFAFRNVSISLFGDFIFLLFCCPVNDQCVLRVNYVILNAFFFFFLTVALFEMYVPICS